MKTNFLAAVLLSFMGFGMSQAQAFSDPPYANSVSFGPQLVKLLIHARVGPNAEDAMCSGILVSPTAVITAAHCLFQKNPSSIDVVDENFISTAEARVETIKIGKGYSGFTGEFDMSTKLTQINVPNHDYAVFELTSAFPMVWPSHAIRLAKSSEESKSLYLSAQCYSAGFGPATIDGSPFASNVIQLHPGNSEFTKHRILVPDHLGLNMPSQLTHGDSGGPVACLNASGEMVLVGINSGFGSVSFDALDDKTKHDYDFFSLIDEDSAFN